jgi:predicted Zn-dependent protease
VSSDARGAAALELAERAVAHVARGEAAAVVQTERSGLARFAASEIHQPTLIENTLVELEVVVDGRSGYASTNRLDDAALAELAHRADEAASMSPADSEHPGLAGRADPPEIAGYDEATAGITPDEQAQRAAASIAAAAPFDAYGFFTSGVVEVAVAATTGLRTAQATTDATALVLAAADGASGYASRTSWRVGEVDGAAAARESSAKAERTRGAVELEPGSYRAVLEPYALAELLQSFAFAGFGALDLLEERSYFAGRLGERAFDPQLSIADDPLSPANLPRGFDFEGTPRQRVQIVEDGVIRGVVWDRRTAARAGGGRQSTGHALRASQRHYGPFPVCLEVAPGDAESAEELASRVGDGIWITRLHYLGVVNPREAVITGMTRDGTFRIRDGRVAEPLVNLRFTLAMPDVFGELLGLTRDRQLVNQSEFYGDREPEAVLAPALATSSFAITGTGSGPGL